MISFPESGLCRLLRDGYRILTGRVSCFFRSLNRILDPLGNGADKTGDPDKRILRLRRFERLLFLDFSHVSPEHP